MNQAPIGSTLGQEDDESEVDEEDEGEDSEDDGDDGQAGYDDKTEPLPSHPAYDARLQQIEAGTLDIVGKIETVLSRHGNNSKDLQNMLIRAREVGQSPEAPKKIIGLLGDTGTGTLTVLKT